MINTPEAAPAHGAPAERELRASRPLAILHLEDSLLDAELVADRLKDAGISAAVTLAQSAPELLRALVAQRFDLVLADYSLPGYDGASALRDVRTADADVPFIFISGTLGEDVAIESLRQGATDYVIKQRLDRLGAAVTRALDEARERQERKRAEERLRRQQEDLVALAEEAQSARRLAEEANRAKDEFLAVVSHELRTPLNAILGWAKLLLAGGLDEEQAHKALTTIERNARAQAQLVDDILDVSRIITGKLRIALAPVSMKQIIEAALDIVRPAAESKGVKLGAELDASPILMGDPDRLQQVVWNLLANAVKFTPQDAAVNVRLSAADGICTVTVADGGQGIDPGFLPFIFDRFRQASEGTTRAHGGLGLGLAIVKHLAEIHGGTIEAESGGAGKGATFVLRLPMTPLRDSSPLLAEATSISSAPPPMSSPALAFPTRLAGVRVLVVDDEPDARELLVSLLERASAVVWSAPDVATGLALLEAHRPDVVVSDIGMPGVDGYGLIAEVRALSAERGGKTPVIALTAFARAEDRARALGAGFDVHLVKPIEPMELLATLVRLASPATGQSL